MKRLTAWNKHRRAAKKRRLAKLSHPKRILRRVGVAGTWLLALITVGLLSFVALFYAFSNVPSPQSLPLAQTAVIQYSDGTTLAKIGTAYYFAYFLVVLPLLGRFEKTKPLPASISESVLSKHKPVGAAPASGEAH